MCSRGPNRGVRFGFAQVGPTSARGTAAAAEAWRDASRTRSLAMIVIGAGSGLSERLDLKAPAVGYGPDDPSGRTDWHRHGPVHIDQAPSHTTSRACRHCPLK